MTVASAFAKDERYKALGQVGAKQCSLDPVGLLDYEVLLYAPEVERNTSASPTPLERAEATRDAIVRAVAGIKEEKLRLVAEAALCTKEPFIGESVKERKWTLKELGVSYKRYRTLRPVALGQVIAYLWAAPPIIEPVAHPATPVAPPSADISEDENLGYNIFCIKRDAIDLYCTGLALLFIADVEARRGANTPALDAEVAVTGPKLLFDRLVAFISTMQYSLVQQQEAFRRSMTRGHRKWTAGKADWLLATASEISALSPVHSEQLHLRDVYSEMWLPWFFDNWLMTDPEATGIEDITGKAGAIGYLLGKRIGVDQQGEAYAKQDALGIVSRYYHDQDDRFDSFFRERGNELVKIALMSHNE